MDDILTEQIDAIDLDGEGTADEEVKGGEEGTTDPEEETATPDEGGKGPDEGDEGTEPDPETGADPEPQAKKGKSKVQERFNQLTREKYQLKAELEALRARIPETQALPEPDPKDFETEAEYIDAKIEHRTQQAIQDFKAKESESALSRAQAGAYAKKEEIARERFKDYDAVMSGPANNIQVSDSLANIILKSDSGPEIAYLMAKNPSVGYAITAIADPVEQALAVGRLEARLKYKSKAKKVSGAPKPMNPVSGTGKATKKLEDMSPTEYRNYMNKKEFGR